MPGCLGSNLSAVTTDGVDDCYEWVSASRMGQSSEAKG